ncbi:MAG: hypothetical protein J1F35_05010 [Erysipelotrichales bacterium]|nr:hypothetical protein [Erysipelotrichales bacterium]
MHDIINLIGNKNQNNEVLNEVDIKFIIDRLCSLYGITLSDIKPIFAGKRFMCYEAINNILYINYKKIKYYNCAALNNYRIMFTIVHELRHYCQFHYCLDEGDDVANLYLVCFDWLSKDNLISKVFYGKNHDYFPIELNADIVAILFILYITKYLGDEIYYTIYLNELDAKIRMIYSKKCSDVLNCLYEESQIKNLKENMSEYNQFLNGILNNKEKSNNIKQMLLV